MEEDDEMHCTIICLPIQRNGLEVVSHQSIHMSSRILS